MNVLVRLGRPFVVALALALAAVVAFAAPNFPALSGRVVDQAGVLSASTRAALTDKLRELEQKSGIQLVVATVSSLEGEEIEPYANDLFRAWKLGQTDKNNGVLLLVAPNEHRVRIEVGYGLEGTLTDAISKLVIVNAVAPRFKSGDFDGGVTRGVDDIITTLTTDASQWQAKPDFKPGDTTSGWPVVVFFVLIVIIIIWNIRWSRGFRSTSSAVPWILGAGLGRGSDRDSGWSGGGGSGGDSFSGDGGSSGGGGASGSW